MFCAKAANAQNTRIVRRTRNGLRIGVLLDWRLRSGGTQWDAGLAVAFAFEGELNPCSAQAGEGEHARHEDSASRRWTESLFDRAFRAPDGERGAQRERLFEQLHPSRETAAEQVPHAARPPRAGYAGFGMVSRWGCELTWTVKRPSGLRTPSSRALLPHGAFSPEAPASFVTR